MPRQKDYLDYPVEYSQLISRLGTEASILVDMGTEASAKSFRNDLYNFRKAAQECKEISNSKDFLHVLKHLEISIDSMSPSQLTLRNTAHDS